ncbi:MAG: hypothetical protein DRQ55_19535 [Planctomycetota bacterium]|nr:MAG: hypothetical protein DRQ55_19535 [Planctomycetota bacterium]
MTLHLLHLENLDQGYLGMSIECTATRTCEYGVDHDDERWCAFADWFDNVGSEMIVDDERHPFPDDPCFPVPVTAHEWGEDGPQCVYDPICHERIEEHRCQLPLDHDGDHRHELSLGTYMRWSDRA